MNKTTQTPAQRTATRAMLTLAEDCLRAKKRNRPELIWLREKYETERTALGLSKAEMDALLYTRMHGCPPPKPSDLLPLRYWRTGYHMPGDRAASLALCDALRLTAAEREYFMMAYMDRALDCYEREPPADDARYARRRAEMDALLDRYRQRNFPGPATTRYLRHRYCLDAMQYHALQRRDDCEQKTIYSINYDTEFRRIRRLLGEIPRRTMLRHLILLQMPELRLDTLQEQLRLLGYLPLTPEHTLPGGEPLDRLLLQMLTLYEELYDTEGPQAAQEWFRTCYRELDRLFVRRNAPAFRFLYFKALARSEGKAGN